MNCVFSHRLMHHVSSGGSAARLTQAHHHLVIIVLTTREVFMVIIYRPRREGRVLDPLEPSGTQCTLACGRTKNILSFFPSPILSFFEVGQDY